MRSVNTFHSIFTLCSLLCSHTLRTKSENRSFKCS
uniref:Uncharacterized protein n=1 Tax=Anguilla anguilla TaxID=7936 RepID=A0A0E9VSG3_ANGAN